MTINQFHDPSIRLPSVWLLDSLPQMLFSEQRTVITFMLLCVYHFVGQILQLLSPRNQEVRALQKPCR